MKTGSIFRQLAFPVAVGALAAVGVFEKRIPLRASVGSKPLRTGRNLVISAVAAMNIEISIIVPTLNEASEIGRALAELRAFEGSFEIIVADGGSSDETCDIARQIGASVINADQGRGIQLHSGALAATGSVLWFLHADSIPPKDALGRIKEALADDRVSGGNFALRFEGDSRAAAFMTRFYDKIRHIGLFYGDSGIFVRGDIYREIGGFKPLPLFEDLEFVGRLKKQGKLVRVESAIITSSRRFDNRPFLPVFLRWVLYQVLYWIGVNPHSLAGSYHPIRRQTARIKSTK